MPAIRDWPMSMKGCVSSSSMQNEEWEVSSNMNTSPPNSIPLTGGVLRQTTVPPPWFDSSSDDRQHPMPRQLQHQIRRISTSSTDIHKMVTPTSSSDMLLKAASDLEEKKKSTKCSILILDKSTNKKKNKKVSFSFSRTQDLIIPPQGPSNHNPPVDIADKWYSPSENDTFLLNAIERAKTIERVMMYAKSNEKSYNSSTGLTSPQALSEYLSNPEEVIGIEHLLSAQKHARECLKLHHKNALLDELPRVNGATSTTSAIATHMAIERATFINLL